MTIAAPGLRQRIDAVWADDIVPTLCQYIAIPNVSPNFDADWAEHGHMDEAVELIRTWCAQRAIAGLTVDVQRLPGRTPLIVCECPATDPAAADRNVLLYGHLDKQPEMTGWREDLGPWKPVVEDDRLYGRGGADDGSACPATSRSPTGLSSWRRWPRVGPASKASPTVRT